MYFIEFERWETQNLFLSSFFLLNFNLSITFPLSPVLQRSPPFNDLSENKTNKIIDRGAV